MNYIRKSLAALLTAAVLLSAPIGFMQANAGTIHEKITKDTVTSGVTHESISRFISDGWLNINVLRVDLSNPNVKVDTLINSESVMKLTSTKALAQSQGAVAAVNGGFFNWTGTAGQGYPDGPVVKSGAIVTGASEYNRYNDSMATFSIDSMNNILYNYWKTDISLSIANKAPFYVAQYNKPSRDYTDITVMDGKWGELSVGSSSQYADIVEVVVANGKVTEVRKAQPAVKIPQNGFIIVTRQAGMELLGSSLKAGDSVKLNISTNPDWTKIRTAVTGSAMLVKDGVIPLEFSMNIPGRHPRTAIGSSRDGRQLIMAAVDGRQAGSIGMTQLEAAQLMLELGAYNAVNMDGGGSTTMVARTPGANDIAVVNMPSDGAPRSVSTAIGIFSTAPAAQLEGITIETRDSNIFENTKRAFTLKGFDKYYNPVQVDLSQVTWSISGVEGSFSGNVLKPSTSGKGLVKAVLGSISAELEINVLSSPVQLELSEKSVSLSPGQTKTFSVSGKDRYGYSTFIDPDDINWSVSGNIGIFTGSSFKAAGSGAGYIDASVGDTHAYCAVSLRAESISFKDGFELGNGAFLSFPASVKGSYEISSGQKHSGSFAGKLSYDFSDTEGTRAAYMVYSNGGLDLDSNTSKLGLWVYNTHPNPNWLRAEVIDAKGSKYLVEFAKGMEWTGWKYVEASLQDVKSPSKLSRIYLVQVSPVSDSGSIYIDDLSAITSGQAAGQIDAPEDTIPSEEAYKSIPDYQPASDSFRFSVYGEAREPSNSLESLISDRLSDKINKYIEVGTFVGSSSHEAVKKLKTPFVSTNTGYKSIEVMSSLFLQLDTSKQGLRLSSVSQWDWLKNQLSSFKGSNIFVFMANSPATFQDKQEAGLFQQLLTEYRESTGRNIWVFYKGDTNSSYMEKGIKYISSAGFDIEGLSNENAATVKYVLVTVKGGVPTFEFKPVISY